MTEDAREKLPFFNSEKADEEESKGLQ